MKNLILCVGVAVAAGTFPRPAASDETVWSPTGGWEAVRQRARTLEPAAAWRAYEAKARSIAATAKPPDTDGPQGYKDRDPGKAAMLVGHAVGRELTERMEHLGIVGRVTEDAELMARGAELLVATATAYPVTHPVMAKSFAGGRGDFMRGLASGLDFFGDGLEADRKQALRAVADGYIDQFIAEAQNPDTWYYGPHNFNGVCGGGAGMLALVLRDSDPEAYEPRIRACVEIITRWLDTSFDEEGAYSEGVGYSQYGLANSLLFARALRHTGGPNLFDHPRLRNVTRFYAMSLLPGETVQDARNDSNYGRPGVECLLLAEANGDGLARYLWNLRGGGDMPWDALIVPEAEPQSPTGAGLPLAMHFRGRGLAVWRTGWDEDDVMAAVEAGPFFPITHNQGDKGHFTLYGRGFRWAVDPGYGNDRKFPLSRCHTLAHNCILIDGKGQAPSGSGLGSNGTLVAFADSPESGYALADCTEAYNRNNRDQQGAGAEHALRHTLFMRPAAGRPPYIVVLDDIRKDDEPHDFTWQMLTWPAMEVDQTPNGFVVRPAGTLSGAVVTTPAETEGKGACTWQFRTETPGRYRVWARVRAGGVDAPSSDSFFVSVDGAREVDWHMPSSDQWLWGEVTAGVPQKEAVFDLQPGDHTLTVATREREAEIESALVLPENAPPPAAPNARPTAGILLGTPDARITAPMTRTPDEPPTARLAVHLFADGETVITADRYEPDDGRSPSSYPRLRATARCVNPRFAAVLLPLPDAAAPPTVTCQRDATGIRLTIAWGNGTDSIRWTGTGNERPIVER